MSDIQDNTKKNKRPIKEKIKLKFLILLLKGFFLTEQHLLKIKNVNYPTLPVVIFSMWHCDQCLVYGIENKEKFYALISASNDGEIIAKAAECLNIKSVRGSSKRHGVSATLEMIDKLKEDNSIAIMVDGPRGPKGKVKEGIINIAKRSGIPIIPVAWTSKDKTYFKFNTWDKFKVPIGPCRSIALYGDPIYIPEELDKEGIKQWCVKLEEEMNRVETDLLTNYDKYKEL